MSVLVLVISSEIMLTLNYDPFFNRHVGQEVIPLLAAVVQHVSVSLSTFFSCTC